MENNEPHEMEKEPGDENGDPVQLVDGGATKQIFEKFIASAKDDPRSIAATRANSLADAGQFDEAEVLYLQCLEMDKLAGRANAHTQGNLCSLYAITGRKEKALALARSAVENNPTYGIAIFQAIPLLHLARYALQCDDLPAANEAVNKALALLRDEDRHQLLTARLLILRAICTFRSGPLSACRSDLDRARELLGDEPIPDIAAGVHSTWEGYHVMRAKLHEREQDWPAAVAAWRQALTHREFVAGAQQSGGPYARVGLAGTLGNLAKALRKVGEVSEAEEALLRANEIRTGLGLSELPNEA